MITPEIEVSGEGYESTPSLKESSHTWDRLGDRCLGLGTRPPLCVVPLEGLGVWLLKAGRAPQLQPPIQTKLGEEGERNKDYHPLPSL